MLAIMGRLQLAKSSTVSAVCLLRREQCCAGVRHAIDSEVIRLEASPDQPVLTLHAQLAEFFANTGFD